MTNAAILIGNTEYRNLNNLACCHDDLLAVKELLEATGKYAHIEIIENADADDLKARVREIIGTLSNLGELFFYFTGHGSQQEGDFYFCATSFDDNKPNETGLSTSELHTLLRIANAELVIKVIDACNSGTLLVKRSVGFIEEKHGFTNLIQISSCLNSQNSLTGDPLSLFTARFLAAALRKKQGEVYYTDIIYTLRDEFLDDDVQTPFFVSQGTGREIFVDDARRLDTLRAKLSAHEAEVEPAPSGQDLAISAPTLRERLEKAELRFATPNQITDFTDRLFDDLRSTLSKTDFAEFFTMAVVEYADFREHTTRDFIVRVLDGESRPDNFVKAKITQDLEPRNRLGLASMALGSYFAEPQKTKETYDLELNCRMSRAQIKISFTPKYNSLHQIVPSRYLCPKS